MHQFSVLILCVLLQALLALLLYSHHFQVSVAAIPADLRGRPDDFTGRSGASRPPPRINVSLTNPRAIFFRESTNRTINSDTSSARLAIVAKGESNNIHHAQQTPSSAIIFLSDALRKSWGSHTFLQIRAIADTHRLSLLLLLPRRRIQVSVSEMDYAQKGAVKMRDGFLSVSRRAAAAPLCAKRRGNSDTLTVSERRKLKRSSEERNWKGCTRRRPITRCLQIIRRLLICHGTTYKKIILE